jgi:hypothetical protein
MKLSPFVFAALLLSSLVPAHADFKAGAAVIDVTPEKLPVFVNGGMTSRSLDKIKTRVNARAIVLADGKTQVAMVVVDSCMMGRPMLDEAKALAATRTGIPTDRILISATHAHSAPASMGCLGTDADPAYVPFLRDKLVEAIAAAQANLEHARIGFAKADAADFTALRQWIRRPDRIVDDPFGNKTVRANMHAGRIWDDVTGEAGPEDPDLSLISIQSRDGRPIAVMGNFSMHYFGDQNISADYFGLFSEGLKSRIAPESAKGKQAFVGIMSHGCSGDIYRVDYTLPEKDRPKPTIEEYTNGLLEIAMKAYAGIEYRADADITMAERRMTLKYRVPDKQRLEWAQRIVTAMGDRLPRDTTEVYAREQILLHERQQTEIVVQALRIGDIGIATTPCETYAITGLKIKAASPLPHNMVIELANGGDGYIPPAEMHLFGGYNTWAARSAGLEVMAEPRITESAILLLEKVSGRPRREYNFSQGPASRAILDLKPIAWWRLNEFAGPHAIDASGHRRDAQYEREITYYLEGPRSGAFCEQGEKNRAPHFVGGRLRARLGELGDRYSVSLWLWNGMPNDGRDVSGWLVSRDHDNGLSAHGDHLGIGGKSGNTGRLVFFQGDNPQAIVAGRTEIPRWQWHHVALVRDAGKVRAYLDGTLELEAQAPADLPASFEQLFLGGRSDNDSNWEGRLDEIAIFNRALSAGEVAKLQVR